MMDWSAKIESSLQGVLAERRRLLETIGLLNELEARIVAFLEKQGQIVTLKSREKAVHGSAGPKARPTLPTQAASPSPKESKPVTAVVLARESGTTRQTIQTYAKAGLLKPVFIDSAGWQFFDPVAAKDRIAQIQKFKRQGYFLCNIKKTLERQEREVALAGGLGQDLIPDQGIEARPGWVTLGPLAKRLGLTRQGVQFHVRRGIFSPVSSNSGRPVFDLEACLRIWEERRKGKKQARRRDAAAGSGKRSRRSGPDIGHPRGIPEMARKKIDSHKNPPPSPSAVGTPSPLPVKPKESPAYRPTFKERQEKVLDKLLSFISSQREEGATANQILKWAGDAGGDIPIQGLLTKLIKMGLLARKDIGTETLYFTQVAGILGCI
jgi:DNA-binding transcriptional MerR regulator